MKLSKLAICMVTAVQVYSMSAYAETVSTTDGPITVNESVAPLGTALSYVSGGDGLFGTASSWTGNPGSFNYPLPANSADAMNNYDHHWLQYNPAIIMQSGTALSSVFAIPGVDHEPSPYENLEFIIWGSNDGTNWEEGKISSIYRDGFDTANTELGHSDDYTSLWKFTGNYTFFMITAGNHLTGFAQDTEGEIDALAAPIATPIPAAIWLFGSALAGLVGISRRNHSLVSAA